MMNDKDFSTIWDEALASPDRDIYVSDWSLSSIFPEDSDLLENAQFVGLVWDVAHMSVQDLVDASGLSRLGFARHFCIKYRTVSHWCQGDRECPDHTRLMIAELLGILPR